MNERIQKLVGRAKFAAEETLNKQISKNAELDAFAEKFAELIVTECMNCAQWVGQVNKTPVEPVNTAHAINQRIKQHFGVNE